MADKHDPSQKALQRWVNEGGAPKGGKAKRPRDPNQLAKSIVGIATGEVTEKPDDPKSAAARGRAEGLSGRAEGLKGGNARASKMTPTARKAHDRRHNPK